METNKNIVERVGQSIRSSVTLKLLSIFILMMLLLIPVSFVQSLISERESLKQIATEEVNDKWANEQYVYGPILTIPLQKEIIENDKIKVLYTEAHILPSKLVIGGDISPKSLRRGIYEVAVYDSKLNFSGRFDNISDYVSNLKGYEAKPEEAFLTIHISDLRGIKEKVIVNWNNTPREVQPGSSISPIINSGITVDKVLNGEIQNNYEFSFDLQVQGSQLMRFVPLGKETNVNLKSNWQDPSFSGSFLPVEREVNKEGFNAHWQVLELNRNYPQSWIGNHNAKEIQDSAFGVDLLISSNDYQKSMRSAKYAILVIALTFLSFFLVEIFNRSRVHPFQYILVGIALCLFYTLLISISEHSNFNLAYLISSVIIISIIGLYSRSIFQNGKQTLVLLSVLSFAYGFVFITLWNQDYALLIGSTGLTLILGFTMYITRNINWYEIGSSK